MTEFVWAILGVAVAVTVIRFLLKIDAKLEKQAELLDELRRQLRKMPPPIERNRSADAAVSEAAPPNRQPAGLCHASAQKTEPENETKEKSVVTPVVPESASAAKPDELESVFAWAKSVSQPPPKPEPAPSQPAQPSHPPFLLPTLESEPEAPSAFEQAVATAFARAKSFVLREGHFWMIAGGVILFIGATFLVRHSMKMGWISPAMRLGGVALLGFALAATGVALKSRRRMYALLLQGCGLSLMYLSTVGAARGAEKLLSPEFALAALSVLVAATAGLALWQNTQVTAHIAVVAGFVAPLLVSTQDASVAGLFAFYLVLNIGILAMTFARPWRRLYLTGFALTFGFFTMWTVAEFSHDVFWQSFPFLAAYYLLYVFMGLRALPPPGVARSRRFSTDVTLTLLAPVFFLSLSLEMVEARYALPAIFATCGVMYAVLSRVLRERGRGIVVLLRSQALVCLNLAIPLLLFDARPELLSMSVVLALVWSLEGACLYISGVKTALTEQRVFGVLLLAAATLVCAVDTLANLEHPQLWFSPNLACNLVLAASFFTCAAIAPGDAKRHAPARFMTPALVALFAALFFEALNVERLAPGSGGYWFLLASSVAASAVTFAAKRVPALLQPSQGAASLKGKSLPLLEVAWLFTLPVALWQSARFLIEWLVVNPDLSAFAETRPGWFGTASWLCFFGAHAFFASRFAPRTNRHTSLAGEPVWRALCVLAAMLFGAQTLMTLFAPLTAINPLLVHFAGRLAAPTLLALLLFPRGTVMRRVADLLRGRPGNKILPLCLCAICLAQLPAIFAADGNIGAWYLPLLTPADLTGLAMTLVPVAGLFVMWRDDTAGDAMQNIGALAWLLMFVWVNVLVGRIAHHYCGVAYEVAAIWRNDSFQTISAFLWGALGIGSMIVSYRRGFRLPWVMGAVLVVADVAKLFLIDLSQLAPVPRIISFIAVGLLLLTVGYFAPLPPQGKSRL